MAWLFVHGYETPFRLFVGFPAIVASGLVLPPATREWGVALALGVISDAIFYRFAGVAPCHDGSTLIEEAYAVSLCAAFGMPFYQAEHTAQIGGLLGRMRLART